MKLLCGVVGLLLAASTITTAVAAQPGGDRIEGQITNGTAGGAAPAGDEVLLLAFGKTDRALKDQRSATLADDGRYAFANLDQSPELIYLALVKHAGVAYPSEPIDLQQTAAASADIQVFEITSSDSAIQFERLNLLVASADPGLMQLYEMGTVVNTGDRTFVPDAQAGAQTQGLRFGLPRGAQAAQMESGFSNADLGPAAGGVQITSSIVPGPHEFALSFQLPYSGTSSDLTLRLPYPTATYNVYLPDGGPRLESDRLASRGRADFGSRSFTLATFDHANDSTVIAARLDDLPSADGGLSTWQLVLLGIGGVLVVLGIGAVAYSIWASRRRGRVLTRSERERERLIRHLALLDERFEAGQIPSARYQGARDRGKRRLVQLTRTLS